MKQLYRSTNERIIGGVAGGMADYLDLDVVLVRLLWVFFAFMGIGVPVYIVAWIIIPAEPYPGAGRYYKGTGSVDREAAAGSDEDESFDGNDNHDGRAFPEGREPVRSRTNQAIGILLVIVGIAFLIRETFQMDIFRYVWPVLLVLLGVYILFNDKRGG